MNSSKTKITHFRKTNVKQTQHCFTLGNQKLETVKQYKYLGVILTEHMDFVETANSQASAGARALGQIVGKTRSNQDLGYKSFSQLYHACVAPVMDYSIGCWNSSKSTTYNKMDQIHYRAVRFFCGLPRTSLTLGLEAEIGWIPPKVRRDLETLRMYNQLVNMPDQSIAKMVF